jgi:hypothetical protein
MESKDDAKQALIMALKFTTDELELNRQGSLSEAQVKGMQKVRFAAVALVVSVIILTLFIIWLFRGLLPLALQVGILISAAVVLAGILQSLYRGWNNADLDITRKRAGQVEGVVSTESKTENNVESFVVKIDNIEFPVEKEVFLAFQNGEPYRIYYAWYSKNILSAEQL